MPDLISVAPVSLDELRTIADSADLYAVLDACDEPRVPVKVRELGPRAVPLYQGEAQDELWGIAPYLAQVDAAMLAWIQDSLRTDPWGIFAVSDAGLDAVRKHFRRFLIVKSPADEDWYFRFYDPRVLAAYLPTCTAAELGDFFGPLSALAWVDAASGEILVATLQYFAGVTAAGGAAPLA